MTGTTASTASGTVLTGDPGTEQGAYAVSYNAARRPYARKTERFNDFDSAAARYTALVCEEKVDSLELRGPGIDFFESHHTRGGLLIVLLSEPDGHWRTALWCLTPSGFHQETITLHKFKNRQLALSQFMPTFSGLCAAERAVAAKSQIQGPAGAAS